MSNERFKDILYNAHTRIRTRAWSHVDAVRRHQSQVPRDGASAHLLSHPQCIHLCSCRHSLTHSLSQSICHTLSLACSYSLTGNHLKHSLTHYISFQCDGFEEYLIACPSFTNDICHQDLGGCVFPGSRLGRAIPGLSLF